jgi:hypothetical protein
MVINNVLVISLQFDRVQYHIQNINMSTTTTVNILSQILEKYKS